MVEGGFFVQGRKELAGPEEEANPAEGSMGKTLVPKEEFFLGCGEVVVGRVEDVRLGGKGGEISRSGGESVVDAL